MRIGPPVACVWVGLLAGCSGASSGGGGGTTAPLTEAALTGSVMSGAQPVVGAHVYLFAAGVSGYGGAGIAASSSNASVSLVNAALTGTADAVGGYVLSGANGQFSLTGDYSCTSGQQLYLYALGGTEASTANAAIGMLAVVGACPASGANAISATVNEVSTIAAAYALAGFATDATHVGSSGTALAQVGVTNAFLNAANLARLSTGVALGTTPAANGTAPQAEINTLANILAGCVNASSASASACTTLFADAESGGSTGTVATDTATAAINIAHNPGANVAALYALGGGSTFSPGLTAVPNDWTVALSFTGGGLNGPSDLAVDGSGNIWITNWNTSSISEFSSTGAAVSPSSGYIGGGLSCPSQIAIDPSEGVWALDNCGGYKLSELSKAGAAISPSTGYLASLQTPNVVSIDGFGNVWVGQGFPNQLREFSNSGSLITPSGVSGSFPIATDPVVDGSENVWVDNETTGNTFDVLSQAWSVISSTTPTPTSAGSGTLAFDGNGNLWNLGPGISKFSVASGTWSPPAAVGSPTYPGDFTGVCIDGSGQVWVSGYYVIGYPSGTAFGTISEFSNDVVRLSPPNGYLQKNSQETGGVAVDGSGNVWTITDTLVEIVGAATPVVTPLSVG